MINIVHTSKLVEEVYLASRSNSLDWKYYRRGWQYSTDAPQNKKWKKDRAELFKKNGNGWWYYHGYILRSNKLDKNEKSTIEKTKKF